MTSAQLPVNVEVTTRGDVPPAHAENLRRELAELDEIVKGPILAIRAALVQEANPRLERPARAQAMADLAGHPVYARVAAETMEAAVDELAERMARHLRRYVDRLQTGYRGPATPERGEWFRGAAVSPRPEHFPRPVGEREIVRRKTFAVNHLDPAGAVLQMEMLDHDFLLYRDADADVDAVAYTRDDGRLGVIVPRGTPLPAAEGPVWRESRFSEPVTEAAAVAEMDALEHRFLYFVNAATGRGNVIYLRYDGHYGLVEPAT